MTGEELKEFVEKNEAKWVAREKKKEAEMIAREEKETKILAREEERLARERRTKQ